MHCVRCCSSWLHARWLHCSDRYKQSDDWCFSSGVILQKCFTHGHAKLHPIVAVELMRSLFQRWINNQLVTSPMVASLLPRAADRVAVLHSVQQTCGRTHQKTLQAYRCILHGLQSRNASESRMRTGKKAGPHYRNKDMREGEKRIQLTWTQLFSVLFVYPGPFARPGHYVAYSDRLSLYQNGEIVYIPLTTLHGFKDSCLLFCEPTHIVCPCSLIRLPQYTTISLSVS